MGVRSGHWPHLVILLGLSLGIAMPATGASNTGAPDVGAPSLDPSSLCERAIVAGARTSGVPQEVLHAISLTETGRQLGGRMRPWPWAINREGQGHWFASRDEALAFARHSLAEGRRSFDVGCFQINYHWHGHNFASLEAMFDQDTGAAYAGQFLSALHAESGDWSRAAGAYHSRTPHYANIYRTRFDRMLAGLGGQPLSVASAATAAVPAVPRKSRLKMTRGPVIIRVTQHSTPRGTTAGRVVTVTAERTEKVLSGRASSVAAADATGWAAASGVVAPEFGAALSAARRRTFG